MELAGKPPLGVTGNGLMMREWNQPVFARILEEVDPYRDLSRFRPLDRAYDGQNTFWSIPSPEPLLEDSFWKKVRQAITELTTLRDAASQLAARVVGYEPDPEKILFVAILRAGVPIADWLCHLLPGATWAAVSLFTGIGIDQVAFTAIKKAYPDRRVIFVDGWTGKGGVAREIGKLNTGPLAVLVDPWGLADLRGTGEDLLCPSACFTGPTTLGFSRTFAFDPQQPFGAYLFPEKYFRPDVIQSWRSACPDRMIPVSDTTQPFGAETSLRLHSNEVCRALINANPGTLYFADPEAVANDRFSLLLELAERRHIPVRFRDARLRGLRTRVGCTLKRAPE